MKRIVFLRDKTLRGRVLRSDLAKSIGQSQHKLAVTVLPPPIFKAGEHRLLPDEEIAGLVEGVDYRLAEPGELPPVVEVEPIAPMVNRRVDPYAHAIEGIPPPTLVRSRDPVQDDA